MIRVSDYILNTGDLRECYRSITRRSFIGVALLIVLLIVLTHFLGFEGGIFLSFAFCLFYWRIDSRFSIKCALICLVIIPIILAISKYSFTFTEDAAERVAVWAFYFLSIGVIKQIWEYIHERSHNERV